LQLIQALRRVEINSGEQPREVRVRVECNYAVNLNILHGQRNVNLASGHGYIEADGLP
jgi:hypothetical protein